MTATPSPDPHADAGGPVPDEPVVRPRSAHNISRRDIDPSALRVLYRLNRSGYQAFLVGGSVRDLLLGRKPKDFDVGTNATPRQIKNLFRHAYIIGRRFRLVHVKFGEKVIETCTFRCLGASGLALPANGDDTNGDDANSPKQNGNGDRREHRRRRFQFHDNPEEYGTAAEDARRRDFTVNGLFYDIATLSVIDHVGGLEDLSYRRLRMIGDPSERFIEDPVRMLRAVRFASRLGFHIERSTDEALRRHHADIVKASPPRLFEEVLRLFAFQAGAAAYKLLWQTGLMGDLLPEVAGCIERNGGNDAKLWPLLEALDRNDTILPDTTPAIQFAALFWEPLAERLRQTGGHLSPRKVHEAILSVVGPAAERLRFPKRLRQQLGFILLTQSKFDEERPEAVRRRFAEQSFFPESLAFREMRQDALNLPIEALHPWRMLADQLADQHEWQMNNASAPRRFEPMGSGDGPIAGFELVGRFAEEDDSIPTAAAASRESPTAPATPTATTPAPGTPVAAPATGPQSAQQDGRRSDTPLSRSARRRRNRRLRGQHRAVDPHADASKASSPIPAATARAPEVPSTPAARPVVPAAPVLPAAAPTPTPPPTAGQPSTSAVPTAASAQTTVPPQTASGGRGRRSRSREAAKSPTSATTVDTAATPVESRSEPAAPASAKPETAQAKRPERGKKPKAATPGESTAAKTAAKSATPVKQGRTRSTAKTAATAGDADAAAAAKRPGGDATDKKAPAAAQGKSPRSRKKTGDTASGASSSATGEKTAEPASSGKKAPAAPAPAKEAKKPAAARALPPMPKLDPNRPLTVAAFFRKRTDAAGAEPTRRTVGSEPVAAPTPPAAPAPSRGGKSGKAAAAPASGKAGGKTPGRQRDPNPTAPASRRRGGKTVKAVRAEKEDTTVSRPPNDSADDVTHWMDEV